MSFELTRADRWNAAFVVLALGIGVAAATLGASRREARSREDERAHRDHVVDVTGSSIPVRDYRRIVSGSLVADRLLLELAEPDRVLAYSTWGLSSSAWAFQYAGHAAIDVADEIEHVVQQRPGACLALALGRHHGLRSRAHAGTRDAPSEHPAGRRVARAS
jgi:hypothetical protein